MSHLGILELTTLPITKPATKPANTSLAVVQKLRSAKAKGKKSPAYADASLQPPPVVLQAPSDVYNVLIGNVMPYSEIHLTVDKYYPHGSTLAQDERDVISP